MKTTGLPWALSLAVIAWGCGEPDATPGNASGGGAGTGTTGGTTGSGGSGGAQSSGGTQSGTGGSPSGGNQSSGGSAGSLGGGCMTPPAASCSSPQVRITDVNVGVTVIGNGNEGDTLPIPLAIAAKPSGGSRVAIQSNDGRVYVAELDCDDQLVGTPFSLPANDFQDIAADANGGVVVLTRDAQGGGTLNCGNEGNLCIAPQNPIPCYDMYMVRFDNAGSEVWASKLTTASAVAPPYSAGGGANHFIWWYQHHARLAHDGTNYAAYFCDAITIANGSCVDIHEGDRMQVVGPNGGEPLSGHDSFAGGCSHSWNTRIVWDERTGHFVMVCATDNNNRVARPAPYRTIFAAPDIGTLSVGDLVLAGGSGYWLTVSYQNTIHLLHFEEATPDQDINAGSSAFSHLVSYGPNLMIVAWETGSGMTAQVRSSTDGGVVSEPFSIAVPDHRYQAFKAFPDGSAAYAAQGANNQSIRIARVLPCSG
jgi:hypothetical protein